MSSLRITGGKIHDPANGIDGEVRDLCIENGSIVASLPDNAPRLDARVEPHRGEAAALGESPHPQVFHVVLAKNDRERFERLGVRRRLLRAGH